MDPNKEIDDFEDTEVSEEPNEELDQEVDDSDFDEKNDNNDNDNDEDVVDNEIVDDTYDDASIYDEDASEDHDDDDDDDDDDDVDDNGQDDALENTIIKNKKPKSKTTKQNIQFTSQYNSDYDSDDDEEDDEDENYLQKFSKEINKQYIEREHPECIFHNYNEISASSKVIRDKNNNIIDPLHRTVPFLTKYEKTRIIGQRAKQINSGAKPFVNVPQHIIDGYIIAELELKQKKIPFIIKRPIPGGGSEYWNVKDLELI